MEHRKSIIYEAIERLDAKMALRTSRFAAKQVRREAKERVWAYSTEHIHSHGTRRAYQQHVLHFLNWCRDQYSLTHLAQVDARANELASQYLTERILEEKSAYTLHTERSALRLFFTQRTLAQDVTLPRRQRESITQSRRPAKRDRDFQQNNWRREIQFLESCGLRKSEALDLRVHEVHSLADGRVSIFVRQGKGGKTRQVPVLQGCERSVLVCVQGREDQQERVFSRLPDRIKCQARRRSYAQHLYQQLSGLPLPVSKGRLIAHSYDKEAVLQVSKALGHNRISVVHRHYLR